MDLIPKIYSLAEREAGVFILLLALGAGLLFHGGLGAFTHGNTYDAYIHMFFADSYNRSWFDTWEPRWYTGFSTTSYPPGTHMIMGALAHLIPLEAAFVFTQTLGVLILILGVYRFSLIWVPPRAAGYAALSLTLAASVTETIHIFGQLPTIFSLGLFLNALPHVFAWLVGEKKRSGIGADFCQRHNRCPPCDNPVRYGFVHWAHCPACLAGRLC